MNVDLTLEDVRVLLAALDCLDIDTCSSREAQISRETPDLAASRILRMRQRNGQARRLEVWLRERYESGLKDIRDRKRRRTRRAS